MTGAIRIDVPGIPVPKGRPRMGRNGHVYTPSRTRAYEDTVRLQAALAMSGKKPLEGPVALRVVVSLPRPKTVKRETPTGRPDLDNFIKAALDGCNNIVFADDSQVCSLEAFKFYDDTPGLYIDAMPWDGVLTPVRAA